MEFNEIKTQEQFPTQKVGNFIYNGVYMYMIIYIYIPLLTKEMSCKKLEILGLMLCLYIHTNASCWGFSFHPKTASQQGKRKKETLLLFVFWCIVPSSITARNGKRWWRLRPATTSSNTLPPCCNLL